MIPTHLNPEELLCWRNGVRLDLWDSAIMEQRLADALSATLDELAECPDEDKIEKRYESPLEQSEFRAQLLREILALCKNSGTKADLVRAIKLAVAESYVEL